MPAVKNHVLTADIGGTHTRLALFAQLKDGSIKLLRHRIYDASRISSFLSVLKEFLRIEGRNLHPEVEMLCAGFAGPVGPDRSEAQMTNLPWRFSAPEILAETRLKEVTLLNDFEAVGFGLEILIANRPEAFVRLSQRGKLPGLKGKKPTLVVLGAGTGLGTVILTPTSEAGKYLPIPCEGGHADYVAVDEFEFRVVQWLRQSANQSAASPLEWEKIVSGPGLDRLYQAVSALEPREGGVRIAQSIERTDPENRPALIVKNATRDPLCRRVLELWLRSYARMAKNCALFPLASGGIFLAGGIAPKILSHLQSGVFMEEFTRCDMDSFRKLLQRTPVFVVTDERIGLFGCVNAALHFSEQLACKTH